VAVALGTDSLASNSSLSMLEELKLIRREAPETPPETFVEMATAAGRRALAVEDAGADITAVSLPEGAPVALESIFEEGASVALTVSGGRVAWESGG
jgi:cytosine/adenosine deaminase-related metal-dependent hydrolase